MNDETAQPSEQNQPPKKKPILLFILLPILAIALVGLLIDYQARSAFESAAAAVDEEFKELDKTDKGLLRDKVHELIGREPDEGDDAKTETYTWKGVFYRYRLILSYGGVDGRLETLEQKPERAF